MGRLLRQDEVTAELSAFLEAIPYQVETWDSTVINNLLTDPNEFALFQESDDFGKWKIYNQNRKST